MGGTQGDYVGLTNQVRLEHPLVDGGHGSRAATASNTYDGGRVFWPNLRLPPAAAAPGQRGALAQGMDADGAVRCSPPQQYPPTNALASPGTVQPSGCVPYPQACTVPPSESPLTTSQGQPRQPPAPCIDCTYYRHHKVGRLPPWTDTSHAIPASEFCARKTKPCHRLRGW